MSNGELTTTPTVTKPGFLTEATGKPSGMRLMSFVALIAAIAFGFFTVREPSNAGLYITFGFLISAFAPKALQKFAESKIL